MMCRLGRHVKPHLAPHCTVCHLVKIAQTAGVYSESWMTIAVAFSQ